MPDEKRDWLPRRTEWTRRIGMTPEAILRAALEEFREEAARCRAGHRMIMVGTVENILRRADAALDAAAKAPEAKPDMVFQIHGQDERATVTAYRDGRVEFGPGFRGDDAARQFWRALATVDLAVASEPETPPGKPS